jgi:hypothetical protein
MLKPPPKGGGLLNSPIGDIEKKYTSEEIAKSIVFPGTKNTREREAVLSEFRDFRKGLSDKPEREKQNQDRCAVALYLNFIRASGVAVPPAPSGSPHRKISIHYLCTKFPTYATNPFYQAEPAAGA